MRRNDHDVTDSICTTDSDAVRDAVVQLHQDLYDGRPVDALLGVFADACSLYSGEHPRYHACDTSYHDIQHVMDVTLAMARLMHGYERSRRNGAEVLTDDLFLVGTTAALFHDIGYLRRRGDRRHRYGSEYTLTHVSRGADTLRVYLRDRGLGKHATLGARLIHFTGYERPTESIRLSAPLHRRLGHMLGTADIAAQMADRCYLEKCRDRLYPEFVLGGLTERSLGNGSRQTLFHSGDDLVRKTPGFYRSAQKRLNVQLARAYRYFDEHFRGQNLYLEEMEKNVQYAELVADEHPGTALRREPPYTLLPEVEPFPHHVMSLQASGFEPAPAVQGAPEPA